MRNHALWLVIPDRGCVRTKGLQDITSDIIMYFHARAIRFVLKSILSLYSLGKKKCASPILGYSMVLKKVLINQHSPAGTRAVLANACQGPVAESIRTMAGASERCLQHFPCEDSNGILWFELQRELDSIYYQRIDFVDADLACG